MNWSTNTWHDNYLSTSPLHLAIVVRLRTINIYSLIFWSIVESRHWAGVLFIRVIGYPVIFILCRVQVQVDVRFQQVGRGYGQMSRRNVEFVVDTKSVKRQNFIEIQGCRTSDWKTRQRDHITLCFLILSSLTEYYWSCPLFSHGRGWMSGSSLSLYRPGAGTSPWCPRLHPKSRQKCQMCHFFCGTRSLPALRWQMSRTALNMLRASHINWKVIQCWMCI